MSHGPGRGRGGWGSTEGESTSMAIGLGRMGTASATVESIFLDFAHQVFDQMPARIQILNFLKVSLWFVNILNKDSRDIFVEQKDDVLQK
jgi:hypothetical protein